MMANLDEQVVDHTDVWSFSKSRQEWVICKVLEDDIDQGLLTLQEDEQTASYQIKKTETCIVDPTHLQNLSDLSNMNNLHEAPLINILRNRWFENQIYTSASDVLISVNPYKTIPGVYESPSVYFNFPRGGDNLEDDAQYYERASELAPHVYMIANRSLRSLIIPPDSSDAPTNQSVIISGESGAGKTEASKHVVNFLIRANQFFISHSNQTSPRSVDPNASNLSLFDTVGIKELIIQSSVIFEAFGNAKTVRNDNSSRFGKYIKLKYSSTFELVSAATETFLLEKSRLVNVGENERNYHVFYQLLRGLKRIGKDLYNELYLNEIESFRILTMGNCTYANAHVDDAEEFESLHQALFSLHCSDEILKGMWMILSSILHLGNATAYESETNGDPCRIEFPTIAKESLAIMLGIDYEAFIRALVSLVLRSGARKSVHTKILSALEVNNNINAVMKWLYYQVFNWLVHTINYAHIKLVDGSPLEDQSRFIGILDIFGFEILTVNSFEQLCINYTNERLQQQFNEYVFLSEQDLYSREGLDWTSISYKDNQNIIDLIAKKPIGILLVLEEHGMMNRSPDDVALLNGLNQHHDKNEAYIKSKFVGEGFSIKHFAGIVPYKIAGFISKNNNSLQEDLNQLLSQSSNPMLRQVIDMSFGIQSSNLSTSASSTSVKSLGNNPPALSSSAPTGARRMSSTVTVSLQFRGQLDQLVKTLRETRPHYIKCIKPNDNKSPDQFVWSMVSSQLRYSGVLEVVRIRREGYPIRLNFKDFYQRYYISSTSSIFCRLYPSWKKSVEDCSQEELIEYCKIILGDSLPSGSYQIGYTLIFLRENGFLEIQRAMKRMFGRFATKIQSWRRGINSQRYFKKQCNFVVILQSLARKTIVRSKYLRFYYHGVCQLQRLFRLKKWKQLMMRMYLLYRQELAQTMALRIQTKFRQYYAFLCYKRMKQAYEGAQTKISSCYRKIVKRRLFLLMRKSIIVIQTRMRGIMTRKRLRIQRFAKFIIQSGISKNYRRLKQQRHYQLTRRKIIQIQCLIRRYLATKLLESLQREYRLKQGLKIQLLFSSLFHAKKQRKWYAMMRRYITMIQSYYRRYQARQLLKYLKEKYRLAQGTKIQLLLSSYYRERKQRKLYLGVRHNVIRIQTIYRMHLAMIFLNKLRQEYRDKKGALIQVYFSSRYRGRKALKKYQIQRKRVVVLQCFIRRKLAMLLSFKMKLERLQKAGTKIQLFSSSNYRKIQAVRKFKSNYKNIVVVQSLIRRYLARRLYMILKRKYSSTLIQSVYRMYERRKSFSMKKFAAIRIQTVYRMHLFRNTYIGIRNLIIQIQSFLRKILSSSKYKSLKMNAIKIQSMYRGYLIRKQVFKMIVLILNLQKFARCKYYRKRYIAKKQASICIQRFSRGYINRISYNKTLMKVIKIQSMTRMMIARQSYIRSQYYIITLQAYIRMRLKKRQYEISYHRIIVLQSLIRKYLAVEFFKYCVRSIVKLQAFGRLINARSWYFQQQYNIILLQSHIRKFIQTQRYHRIVSHITRIQSVIRRYVQRCRYHRSIWVIIKMQSYGRMYIQMRSYEQIQYYCILLQAAIRRFNQRIKYTDAVSKIIRLQAFVRCKYLTHYYKYVKKSSLTISRLVRGLFGRKIVRRIRLEHSKARLLQRYFRSLVRNLKLYHFVHELFTYFQSPLQIEKDILLLPYMRKLLFKQIRNRFQDYETLIQAVFKSNSRENLLSLNPNPYDLIELDIKGNTCLHIAMKNIPDFEVINELFLILDHYKYVYPKSSGNDTLITEEGDSDDDNDDDNSKSKTGSASKAKRSDQEEQKNTTDRRESAVLSNIAEIMHGNPSSAVNGHDNTVRLYNDNGQLVEFTIIHQGFLRKKSEGLGFWQKRYFILTDTSLQYYGSGSKPKNLLKPRLKINLNGCIINRYNPGGKTSSGTMPIIEILLPNFAEKKNFFGKVIQKKSLLFQAIDEKDLQDWLCPVKAVAGMVGFRESAVKYVLLDVHEQYVNQVNLSGETPLHVLLKTFQQYIVSLRNETARRNSGAMNLQLIKKKVLILASYFIDKGLDLEVKDSRGYTIMDLCKLYHFGELLHYLDEIGDYLSFRKQTIRLRGYSYLNIFYGNMIMNLNNNGFINYSTYLQPRLRISIFNTKRQLFEDMVEIGLPVIQDTSSYWWGSTWFMGTPLENVQAENILITEFFEQPGILAAWNRYDFSIDTIDSGMIELPMRKPPMLWDSSGSTTSRHRDVIGVLNVNIMLTRKMKTFTISDIRKTEAYVNNDRLASDSDHAAASLDAMMDDLMVALKKRKQNLQVPESNKSPTPTNEVMSNVSQPAPPHHRNPATIATGKNIVSPKPRSGDPMITKRYI